MRKVIFGINLTIDGCCDHTKVDGYEDIHEYFAQLLRDADVLVYGRKTYQLMVPFWPDVAKNRSGGTKAMNDFAQAFAAVKNIVVFSKSLDRVDEPNARVVRANPQEEIRKLKQQPGKNICLGGVDLASQLITAGLVDEYYFVIHPVVAGEGRRLLDGMNLPENLRLKLADSKVLPSGCVALHYTNH